MISAALIVSAALAAALRREIIGFAPVLAPPHRIDRAPATVRYEARQVPCYLRFGRMTPGLGLGHGAGLAQPIDLDDIGCHAALGRLPNETGRKAGGQRQTAERHQPPVARLPAGGPADRKSVV